MTQGRSSGKSCGFYSCVLTAVLPALLSACAQQPAHPDAAGLTGNVLLAEARAQEREGSRAFLRYDSDGAQGHYQRAAQIYQSLALADPLARAQLSQARVLAQAGQLKLAQQQVAAVLENSAALPPGTLAAAHGRAASLSLQDQPPGLAAAEFHLSEAEKLCATHCPEASALWTLRGRLHLARAEPQAALDAALQAGRTATAPSDQANALRLTAQSRLLLGAPAEALAQAGQALALDQASGAAERVAMDLALIAQAYRASGDTVAAQRTQTLAERSAAATRALRNRAAAP